MAAEVKQPFDLIRFALGERVTLKFRGDKTITGKLNGYDTHLNLILSNVEETTKKEENSVTREVKRNFEVLFVRGDGIIHVCPPVRI